MGVTCAVTSPPGALPSGRRSELALRRTIAVEPGTTTSCADCPSKVSVTATGSIGTLITVDAPDPASAAVARLCGTMPLFEKLSSTEAFGGISVSE